MGYHKNGGPRLLQTDRNAVFFLERARVRCDGGRVVYDVADDTLTRTFNIPFANISVILLGQGTSLTNDAARLLAEEGTLVAFTGTAGTPIFFASQISYRPTDHLQRWISVWSSERSRLAAAKSLLKSRREMLPSIGLAIDSRINDESIERLCSSFERAVLASSTTEMLLGHEGQYAKKLYSLFASAYQLSDWKRMPGEAPAKSRDAGDSVNAALDYGNYLAYGIAGVVLWTLGIPASLAALHGKTRAGGLVFDLADTIKDAFVLPIAFAQGIKDAPLNDQAFRERLVGAFDKHKALARSFKIFEEAIQDGEIELKAGDA